MEMKPQFKDLQFKSMLEFNKWLNKTHTKIINLKDKGQDLQRLWISESGEILHANMQAFVYNGRFVNIEKLVKNTNLTLWNGSSWDVSNLEIEKVIIKKHLNKQ